MDNSSTSNAASAEQTSGARAGADLISKMIGKTRQETRKVWPAGQLLQPLQDSSAYIAVGLCSERRFTSAWMNTRLQQEPWHKQPHWPPLLLLKQLLRRLPRLLNLQQQQPQKPREKKSLQNFEISLHNLSKKRLKKLAMSKPGELYPSLPKLGQAYPSWGKVYPRLPPDLIWTRLVYQPDRSMKRTQPWAQSEVLAQHSLL